MLDPAEPACISGTPRTEGRCGGGSDTDVVNEESGSVEEGVLDNRSLYDMNERRLVCARGEGGCETVAEGKMDEGELANGTASEGSLVMCVGVSRCSGGCSRVVVVGEEAEDEDGE